jgi:seryl-tRNA synthetase
VPLYEENCTARNYKARATYPARINSLFEEWNVHNQSARGFRTRNNLVIGRLANQTSLYESEHGHGLGDMSRERLIEEGKRLKAKISDIERQESAIMSEVEALAAALPNLTSDETPHGDVPTLTEYILDHPHSNPSNSDRVWRSHVHIGSELGILDFAGAAITSGWGWYFLRKEAAELEDALVKYALSVAKKLGWERICPPSMVYSHIAGACGFQPRDQNGESQIYNIQQNPDDVGRKPPLSLAGTAEIPLAGMKANTILEETELPMKCIGVSRCYRAEAGARGVDTKGLYRVHEFTKVEMFAWTKPSVSAQHEVFDEILSIQTTILKSLGLHSRVLEMPSTDLGASASRKCDIETFFPSRTKDDGYGEVTSVSTCTDYQTRRLATRLDLRSQGGKIVFPYTVNGTAMAIPRVLAAILENGWDEERKEVRIPEVLWPYMDGLKVIKK